jgi:hypothetical protein
MTDSLYQSPTDIFDLVLCLSQPISQIMVGLCDRPMFTIEIAIISIHEASLSYCVAKFINLDLRNQYLSSILAIITIVH